MNRNSKVETTLAGRKTDKPQLPPPGYPVSRQASLLFAAEKFKFTTQEKNTLRI